MIPEQPGADPMGEDGRQIDPRLGALTGEGAQQRPRPGFGEAGTVPAPVWEQAPSRDPELLADPTYYGQPAIKPPVWIWTVPAYFYVGGVAGTASVVGAVAQCAGRDGFRNVIARCRWLGALGTVVGSGLLIADLGRPERFLNMLRVFRPTSAMSVGSWALAAVGGMAAGAAPLAGARGILRSVGDAAGCAAGVAGLPLAGYTAVLVANTAVPAWQEARHTLPPLFLGSAMAATAALLQLRPLSDHEETMVRRFGTIGQIAALAAMLAVERDVSAIDEVGRPLRGGVPGTLWRAAQALEAAGLLLSAMSRRRARPPRLLAAALGTAAALALRFAVFHLGKASARDPRATFHQQRAGHGAAAVTGRSAVAGPRGQRAADGTAPATP
jgi:formate-dependent nitrite reductase membrane component NrfD